MTIALDTPEQISLWVLLSRRHQIQMHLKGLTTRGLAAALKREFPGQGRYVKDFIVPVEFAISQGGGEVDYNLVNVHIMLKRGGLFLDRGIFDNLNEVDDPQLLRLFAQGKLEIVLTTEPVRPANGQAFVPA